MTDQVVLDTEKVFQTLFPLADDVNDGEPTEFTPGMWMMLNALTNDLSLVRVQAALDRLVMQGYIYKDGTEDWFDPQGMRGERAFEALKLE